MQTSRKIIEPHAAAEYNSTIFKAVSDMLLHYADLRPAELKLVIFIRGYMDTHDGAAAPTLDIIRHLYGPYAGIECVNAVYVHARHANDVLAPMGERIYAKRGAGRTYRGYVWEQKQVTK